MADTAADVRRTPLDAVHDAAGARMVPFAGWRMPLQYADGIIAEHLAVRSGAGVFDVSHMGELVVRGRERIARLQGVLANDLARIPDVGSAQYTLLLAPDGGIEDDLIAYRTAADELLLVVNAGNRRRVAELLAGIADDVSDQWAMFALQGPDALSALAGLGPDVRELPPFRFVEGEVAGCPCIVATTGYTGERGCELLLHPGDAPAVWAALVADARITPCGLGARDTLRLEACFPLHGNDIDATRDPLGAGLGFAAPATLDDLPTDQHRAVRELRAAGPARRLVPLLVTGRGIPRAGMAVRLPVGGDPVGEVTSGTMSPVLRAGIALAWLDTAHAAIDTDVELDVRGSAVPARVVRRPFVAGSPVR